MAPNDQHPRNDSTIDTNASLATSNTPEEGDIVSWKWSGGQPSGMVTAVQTGETQIQTKHGNTVARHGTQANPALEIVDDTTGSKVLKKASEVQVEEKFQETKNSTDNKKKDSSTVAGEKRSKPEEASHNSAKENESDSSTSSSKRIKISLRDKKESEMEKELEGKGLAKDDKDMVKDHVEDLTEQDLKEPVSRRTRSKEKGTTDAGEALVAAQLF